MEVYYRITFFDKYEEEPHSETIKRVEPTVIYYERPSFMELMAIEQAEAERSREEADRVENGGPIDIAGRKIGPFTTINVIVSMSDYHYWVKVWMSAKPCTWEQFLSRCKEFNSTEWHKFDMRGRYRSWRAMEIDSNADDISSDEDGDDDDDHRRLMQKNYLRNMRALYDLPFPKEVVLAVAEDNDYCGVLGVCSACCQMQERYKKLSGGKELPAMTE
jgi:hypothetical protein